MPGRGGVAHASGLSGEDLWHLAAQTAAYLRRVPLLHLFPRLACDVSVHPTRKSQKLIKSS
jgi:hypothetical protein